MGGGGREGEGGRQWPLEGNRERGKGRELGRGEGTRKAAKQQKCTPQKCKVKIEAIIDSIPGFVFKK